MKLSPGTRLGPYELTAALAAGGMGAVYRARDTRLERLVAVKVLPAHLALDPEARARFEREARAVAALSHPNILAIHDYGAEGQTAYVVTELLAGETLRARLDAAGGGPAAHGAAGIPRRKAVDIAIQIAQGLAAAHDRNIVHRDLKPENIFVGTDGLVKILDFGLARTIEAPAAVSSAPTELRTDPGTVMGTVGYMAPEQVKGMPADHRADLFSFGCVLYEMLTGRRAFERQTMAETMTAILRDDLPSAMPDAADLPPALDQIVRHCLEKEPHERFQSAHDLTFALKAVSTSPSGIDTARVLPPARRRAGAYRFLASMGVVGICAGAAGWSLARRPVVDPGATTIRAVLPLPANIAVSRLSGGDDATIAASPDGRLLAFVDRPHSEIQLHDLETGASRTLVKEGALGEPVFSPDGRYLAYVSGLGGSARTGLWGSLRKVSLSGGGATTLAGGMTSVKGAAWGNDGWIYYCPEAAFGLWRVSADGGPAEKLTDPDASAGEKTHRRPFVLPGGKAVLFVVGTSKITSFDDGRIEALRLSDRSRHRLIEGGTAPRYLPTGHLLYERAGHLLAVPFDPDALVIKGAPVTVADGVEDSPRSGTSYYTVSANGTLFYIPRQATVPPGTILALDEHGRATRLADAPFIASSGRLSPDGRYVAIDPDGATQQIAIVDLARNSLQQITFEWDNSRPLWTADGARLIFRSNAGGGSRRVHWQAADGSGAPKPISTLTGDELPTSLHGDRLLVEDVDRETRSDIWLMSLADGTRRPFVKTPFDESAARFSPDGRWVVYQAAPSGSWEIFVQPAAPDGGRRQVSRSGGTQPMWQPDGRAITYRRGLDLMRVSFPGSLAGELGTPARLFSLEPEDLLLDVMPNGRWLVLRPAQTPPWTSVNVVTNWFDHVRRSVGGDR